MARTTWMRLFFRGLPSPQAEEHNGLGQEIQQRLEAGGDLCEAFDVVLANPPFMELPMSLDLADRLKALGQLRTEALFLEVILDLLKPGGRAVIALPEGFLANRGRNSKKVMALRERLITQNQVHAVISLPPASFLPHAAQATSLLVLTKGGTTSRTWMYEVEQDGFSLGNVSFSKGEAFSGTNLSWKDSLQNQTLSKGYITFPSIATGESNLQQLTSGISGCDGRR